MPVTYRVMVSGFGEAARRALEPCFARRSLIAYLPVDDLSQADLVVVDSDDAAASAQALHLLQPHRVVFVGATRPPDVRWHVPAPLDAAAVLARLDELVATEKPAPYAFTDPFLSLLKPVEGALSFNGFVDRERDALAPLEAAGIGAEQDRRVVSRHAVHPLVPTEYVEHERFEPVDTLGPARPEPTPPATAMAPSADPSPPEGAPAHEAAVATDRPEPPPDRSAKATMRAAVRRAQREAMGQKGPAISAALIVERHAPNRLLLVELLGSFGFQPVSASTVDQAERHLVDRAFGVVFLGMVDDPAGEVAGIELCHRIKQRAIALPALPPRVVMVWSRPRAADHVRARLAGCDHFITGPVGRGPVAQALEAIGVPMPQDPRGRGFGTGDRVGDASQRSVSTTGA